MICGALGTTRWTITNGDVASVADLCGLHSLPLEEAVTAAGLNPPAVNELTVAPVPVTQRQPRKPSYETLSWTPPAQ